MNYLSKQIVFNEIPDEVSLSFLITGCQLRCAGCHSADAWNRKNGQFLSLDFLTKELERLDGIITCVLFLGGEWEPTALFEFLNLVKSRGLKTALYSGRDIVDFQITSKLDFLKTGPYISEKGGVFEPGTNQILINLNSNQILNKPGVHHDPTYRSTN